MTPATRLLGVIAVGLLATACGNDGDDGDDGGRAVATTTSSAVDVITTTTEDPEGIGDVDAVATQLLVTAAELGVASLQDAGYTPTEGPDGCGFDLAADHPSLVQVGTNLTDGQLTVVEELRVYDGIDPARAAFDAAIAARCPATSDGATAGTPADASERVGADAAVAIPVTVGGAEGVDVLALVTDALVSIRVLGSTGTPDPLDVAAFAVGKILAALEG